MSKCVLFIQGGGNGGYEADIRPYVGLEYASKRAYICVEKK
ncbi:MAG: hypothetical protein ABIN67_17655 [Ferruginibacter sp.]